jgi:hypothetical protein
LKILNRGIYRFRFICDVHADRPIVSALFSTF